MDISDDGEEGGGVKRRPSRVGQVSFLQDLPSVQGVVVHVTAEPRGDSLGQVSLYQHCQSYAPSMNAKCFVLLFRFHLVRGYVTYASRFYNPISLKGVQWIF